MPVLEAQLLQKIFALNAQMVSLKTLKKMNESSSEVMERSILVKNEMMVITLMMMVVILHAILSLSGYALYKMVIVKILVLNALMAMVLMKIKVNELLFEEMDIS